MNRNLFISDKSVLGLDDYVSPEMEMMEIKSEGILCSSFQEYDEFDVEW